MKKNFNQDLQLQFDSDGGSKITDVARSRSSALKVMDAFFFILAGSL